MIRIFLSFLLIVLFSVPVGADTFRLKSGKVIEGEIVSYGDKKIKIKTKTGIVSIKQRMLDPTHSPFAQKEKENAASLLPPAYDMVDIGYVTDEMSLDKSTTDEIRNVIGKIVAVYINLFGVDFKEVIPIRIRIFKDLYGYQIYRKRVGGNPKVNTGFYSHRTKEIITWKNGSEPQMMSIIYHEVNHAILYRKARNIPRWIDEGVAEFFEYAFYRDGSLFVGVQDDRDLKVKQLVYGEKIMDLKKYINLSNREWDKAGRGEDGVASSMSWSLISFLMSSDEGRAALAGIMQSVTNRGFQKFPSERAINHFYRGGIGKLENDWHRWVVKKRMQFEF